MVKELIVQIGTYELMKLPEGKINNGRHSVITAIRPYHAYFYCPNCFKLMHLGRFAVDEEWTYDDEDTICIENSLSCNTEKTFKTHLSKCKSTLSEGINKVDDSSSHKSHTIVSELSIWSNRECGWDSAQVYECDFHSKNGHLSEVVAYVFVNEIGPISYVAFRLKDLGDESMSFSSYVLWDLYTFPPYRNNGIATQLLEHGMNDLGIDTDKLAVSFPLTDNSLPIVLKICSDRVLALRGNDHFVVPYDDIVDFNKSIRWF